MKKITFTTTILLFVFILSGCKDFLNLPPKSQRAVETLQDVKSVLSGYLDGIVTRQRSFIAKSGPPFVVSQEQQMMFEAYSDNIDMDNALYNYFVGVPNAAVNELYYANKLMFNDFDTPKALWTTHYEGIGFQNTLISKVNEIQGGDETTRNLMLGEMYMHRAYYLFKLLQYFAPYDKAEMGIPVYLNTAGETYGVPNPRKSQKESYDQIITDLTGSLTLIAKTPPKSGFSAWYNERYINNLLAQVYWFKAESAAKETSDYTNAKKYALAAVKDVEAYIPTTTADFLKEISGELTSLKGYPAYGNAGNNFNGCGAFWASAFDYSGNNPSKIPLNPVLVSLFSTTDIRYSAGIKTGNFLNAAPWIDNGTTNSSKYGNFLLFQPEEAYLILAEAHYRLNETGESVAVLNKFKGFRNAGTATGLTGTALLQEIKNERRKEFFCRSDKRWLDLKRYGDATITRTNYTFFKKQYSVTVTPNDFHYALPIPVEELQLNPALVANPGWVPIVF